jgi:hypothetical protein
VEEEITSPKHQKKHLNSGAFSFAKISLASHQETCAHSKSPRSAQQSIKIKLSFGNLRSIISSRATKSIFFRNIRHLCPKGAKASAISPSPKLSFHRGNSQSAQRPFIKNSAFSIAPMRIDNQVADSFLKPSKISTKKEALKSAPL